ncbi:flavodoxin domain-containing protein, partial [uncultured Clostridium sp.]|uniref:flavodoxin domain-containing protein n=1 Tax=uncultured Clostridium sp. TaxID=59620 RepID=UPI0025CC162D
MKIVYYSLSGNTKRMAELIADGIKMSGKDAELVDFESISAEEAANEEKEADIVYKAEAQGKEVVFYILLEFQSSVDYTMPLRLLLFLKLKP